MVFSSLNRETTIFIPIAFLFANVDLKNILKNKKIPWNTLSWFFLYSLIWLIIYLALRVLRGYSVNVISFSELWAKDSSLIGFSLSVIQLTLFIGVFWIFSILGYKKAPTFIKKVSLAIPIFVLPIVSLSILYEVRPFMFLYPLLIGLGLAYLFPNDYCVTNEKESLDMKE
jgi:hypothetical protein